MASWPGTAVTEPASSSASLRSASRSHAASTSGSVSRLAMSRSRRRERSAGASFRTSASRISRFIVILTSGVGVENEGELGWGSNARILSCRTMTLGSGIYRRIPQHSAEGGKHGNTVGPVDKARLFVSAPGEQVHEVMGSHQRFGAPGEECLQRLLRSLVAMVCRGVGDGGTAVQRSFRCLHVMVGLPQPCSYPGLGGQWFSHAEPCLPEESCV